MAKEIKGAQISRRDLLWMAGVGGAAALIGGKAERVLAKADAIANLSPERVPAGWPQGPDAARAEFGFTSPTYYAKDVYKDNTGAIRWDGTWKVEPKPLKVPFRADGVYLDASGNPLPNAQIWDESSAPLEYADVKMGRFAQTFTARAQGYDGTRTVTRVENGCSIVRTGVTYFANGDGVMPHVEQAVIFTGTVGDPNPKERGRMDLAELFEKSVETDKDGERITMALWGQDAKKFFVVQRGGTL